YFAIGRGDVPVIAQEHGRSPLSLLYPAPIIGTKPKGPVCAGPLLFKAQSMPQPYRSVGRSAARRCRSCSRALFEAPIRADEDLVDILRLVEAIDKAGNKVCADHANGVACKAHVIILEPELPIRSGEPGNSRANIISRARITGRQNLAGTGCGRRKAIPYPGSAPHAIQHDCRVDQDADAAGQRRKRFKPAVVILADNVADVGDGHANAAASGSPVPHTSDADNPVLIELVVATHLPAISEATGGERATRLGRSNGTGSNPRNFRHPSGRLTRP